MPTPRCTKAEHEHRVNIVFGWLCEGIARAQILRDASEIWGIGERQAEGYMANAREILRELGQADVIERRGLALARHEELYVLAKDKGATFYNEARLNLAEMSRLEGLYAPERKELTGANGGPMEMTLNGKPELLSRLSGLIARAAAGEDSKRESDGGGS